MEPLATTTGNLSNRNRLNVRGSDDRQSALADRAAGAAKDKATAQNGLPSGLGRGHTTVRKVWRTFPWNGNRCRCVAPRRSTLRPLGEGFDGRLELRLRCGRSTPCRRPAAWNSLNQLIM